MTIGFCSSGDAPDVMSFVRDYWSPTHVLAQSRALFDWQYSNRADGGFNFVVAKTAGEGIVGVLGFIPLSRYDSSLAGVGRETVWLALWKVRPDMAHGLGVRLLLHLQRAYPHAWIGTVGLNQSVVGLYRALGYQTGELTRFALVNPDCADFRLALIPQGWAMPGATTDATQFRPLSVADFSSVTASLSLNGGLVPHKTAGFVRARYLEHPYYRYHVHLATLGGRTGLVVTRCCDHAGARALRIVDFVGDPSVLAEAGAAFHQLVREEKAEYLDFFASGLDEELTAAGLIKADSVRGLILPGYFEPFDAANVTLRFCVRGPAGRVAIFKGDADQDRPNLMPPDSAQSPQWVTSQS